MEQQRTRFGLYAAPIIIAMYRDWESLKDSRENNILFIQAFAVAYAQLFSVRQSQESK
jgi:hypothetical protein